MTIIRPDGRVYRPRSTALRALSWVEEQSCGVVVLGTMNPQRAAAFGTEAGAFWHGPGELTQPEPGWYRESVRNGERCIVTDERRGRPGVYFTWEECAPVGDEIVRMVRAGLEYREIQQRILANRT